MDIKRLLISSLLFLVSHMISAQNNYSPGYIITLEQDTVHGLIDLRTDKMNARCCVFKQDADASPTAYYPGDIWGYRFEDEGKLYISHSIELKHDSVANQLFLECLFQGMKNLYYYEDDDNEEFYFLESQGRLVKLDAPVIEKTEEDGRKFKKEVNRYIPTLHYVFRDSPTLHDKIDHTPFTHKGLIDLVRTYHDTVCNSEDKCITLTAKEDKPKLRVTVTPYVGLLHYAFLDDLKEYGNPDLAYLVGINAAISCPRWMSSLSLVVDLSLSKLSAKDAGKESSYSSILLSGKLGGCYTYPVGAVRPFIGVGGIVSGFLSAKYKVRDIRMVPFGGAFPGYYVNLGLQIPVSKKSRHAIMIRGQFEGTRDTFSQHNVFTAWSGALGYSF